MGRKLTINYKLYFNSPLFFLKKERYIFIYESNTYITYTIYTCDKDLEEITRPHNFKTIITYLN